MNGLTDRLINLLCCVLFFWNLNTFIYGNSFGSHLIGALGMGLMIGTLINTNKKDNQ